MFIIIVIITIVIIIIHFKLFPFISGEALQWCGVEFS